MRSAMSVVSATGSRFGASAEGSDATSCMICGIGSMAMPRMAFTPWGETSAVGVLAPLKTMRESLNWEEKLPRSRKMADGLSLESLCARGGLCQSSSRSRDGRTFRGAGNPFLAKRGVRLHRSHRERGLGTHGERGARCGQRENARVPRRKTQMWLIVSALGSSKQACVSSNCCRFVCRRRPATQQPNMAVKRGRAEGFGRRRRGCGSERG